MFSRGLSWVWLDMPSHILPYRRSATLCRKVATRIHRIRPCQ